MDHQLEIECEGKETINILVTQKQGTKKGRKIKTWSSQEDQQLLEIYKRFPKKWGTIASLMVDRNQNQCLHRYRRLVIMEDKQKIWTEEEDREVLMLVKKGGKNWNTISKVLKTKNGKQIRERYINKLDPGINRGEWTQQQDFLLISLYIALGSKWSEIGKRIPGRPENKIKNRFYSYIRRVYNIEEIGEKKVSFGSATTSSVESPPHSCCLDILECDKKQPADTNRDQQEFDHRSEMESYYDAELNFYCHPEDQFEGFGFRSSFEDESEFILSCPHPI